MIVFLRWWLVFWLSVFAGVAGGALGFYPYLWRADASYLSWVCLALYALMTVFVGQLTCRARHGDQGFRKHLPLCWYVAACLMALGLIGTLVGILIIPEAIRSGLTDPAKVLERAADALSTAGLTTIVGLACSLALRLQLINLQYQLRGDE